MPIKNRSLNRSLRINQAPKLINNGVRLRKTVELATLVWVKEIAHNIEERVALMLARINKPCCLYSKLNFFI